MCLQSGFLSNTSFLSKEAPITQHPNFQQVLDVAKINTQSSTKIHYYNCNVHHWGFTVWNLTKTTSSGVEAESLPT